jgi:hypothetical protein
LVLLHLFIVLNLLSFFRVDAKNKNTKKEVKEDKSSSSQEKVVVDEATLQLQSLTKEIKQQITQQLSHAVATTAAVKQSNPTGRLPPLPPPPLLLLLLLALVFLFFFLFICFPFLAFSSPLSCFCHFVCLFCRSHGERPAVFLFPWLRALPALHSSPLSLC